MAAPVAVLVAAGSREGYLAGPSFDKTPPQPHCRDEGSPVLLGRLIGYRPSKNAGAIHAAPVHPFSAGLPPKEPVHEASPAHLSDALPCECYSAAQSRGTRPCEDSFAFSPPFAFRCFRIAPVPGTRPSPSLAPRA